jgi:hypothetical protein
LAALRYSLSAWFGPSSLNRPQLPPVIKYYIFKQTASDAEFPYYKGWFEAKVMPLTCRFLDRF